MKIASKITAVFMAVVLLFTMATPVFAATSNVPKTRAEYAEMVSDEGYSAITTAEFLQKWDAVGDFFNKLTGGKVPSGEKISIAFDEYLISLNIFMVKNSGLDIIALAERLPALSTPAEFIANKVELDTVAFRNEMYQLRDESNASGDSDMALIYHLLGAYMSIIDKCYFYTVPTANPTIYELCLEVTYRDGATENVGTGLLIDSVSGEIYGKAGNGILGVGFNFNVKEMMVYALVNSWHRNLGFAVTYDVMAAVFSPLWNIITRRFYFEYDGLEWLIQAWKGIYFQIANGAEVGVYNRVPGEELGTFYNCATDDQLMTMTMKLSHKDTTILDLGPQKHWWINGFKMTGKTYDKETLRLEFSIEMVDMEMVNAFVEAIENEEHNDTSYSVKGTTVSVVW